MKIIDEISSKVHLVESGQGQKQVKFAMIDPENGKTITPFCKCKDYFTDMFWSNSVKKPVNIYGFSWTPDQDKGVLKNKILSIAIKLQDSTTKKVYEVKKTEADIIKSLLNKFEKKLKFKLSKTEICSEKQHIILTISKDWSEKPYLVSCLFFLIRLGFTYDGKTDPIEFFTKAKSSDYIAPYDEGYFRTGKKKLEDLLKGKIDEKQKYDMYTAANIHNASGLVGYKDYSI